MKTPIEDRFTGEFSEEIVSVSKSEEINSKARHPPSQKIQTRFHLFFGTIGTGEQMELELTWLTCIVYLDINSDQVSDTVLF